MKIQDRFKLWLWFAGGDPNNLKFMNESKKDIINFTHTDTHIHTQTQKMVEYIGMVYTIILSENDQEGMQY